MPDAPYPPVEVPEAERQRGVAPAHAPKIPLVRAPVGSCDAHVHVLSGPGEHALWEGRVEDPAPDLGFEDWMAMLREHLDLLGCTRVVVVHSILYGTDNAVTLEALRRLGDMARGVALVSGDADDAHLDALAAAGCVAVRLNYVHGGALSWPEALALAPRLADRGMHLQMLMHADRHMAEVAQALPDLPVPLVVDHAGWPSEPGAPTEALERHLAEGRVWVKLSGVYRQCAGPYEACDALIERLVAANPERCLWGSDWPHIMLRGAAMPDAGTLLDAFMRAVPASEDRQRILVDNPAKLHGF